MQDAFRSDSRGAAAGRGSPFAYALEQSALPAARRGAPQRRCALVLTCLVGVSLALSACALVPERREPDVQGFATPACSRPPDVRTHDARVLPAGDDRTAGNAPSPPFSPRAAQMARIVGVAPLLGELVRLGSGSDTDLRRVVLRQRITDRILLSVLDVQRVLAELDCERARGEHARSSLVEEQVKRNQRYTMLGALAGATTAIASGGLSVVGAGTAANVAQILGGSVEGAIRRRRGCR